MAPENPTQTKASLADQPALERMRAEYVIERQSHFSSYDRRKRLLNSLNSARKKLGLEEVDEGDDTLHMLPESLPDEVLNEKERAVLEEAERQIEDPEGEYQRTKRELVEIETQLQRLIALPEDTREEVRTKRQALRDLWSRKAVSRGSEVFERIPRFIGSAKEQEFWLPWDTRQAYGLTPLYRRVSEKADELVRARMELHSKFRRTVEYVERGIPLIKKK